MPSYKIVEGSQEVEIREGGRRKEAAS